MKYSVPAIAVNVTLSALVWAAVDEPTHPPWS